MEKGLKHMLLTTYNKFIKSTTQFSSQPDTDQIKIALFGLVGELGSVVSAVKKKMLSEDSGTIRHAPATLLGANRWR